MSKQLFQSLILGIAVTCVAAPTFAAGKFSASSVPGAKIKGGKIEIRNDATHITAFQFDGNIKTALVQLRSIKTLAYKPNGSVYQSNAAVSPTLPPQLAGVVKEAATTHGVDPRLITAVIHRESAFNPLALSHVGAQGLMQLMPATARYLGVKNAFDPRENVLAGTRYLRMLLDTFHGDLDLSLAAYNAGPGAVAKYKGIPPYRETRNYVTSIRASYERALQPSL